MARTVDCSARTARTTRSVIPYQENVPLDVIRGGYLTDVIQVKSHMHVLPLSF